MCNAITFFNQNIATQEVAVIIRTNNEVEEAILKNLKNSVLGTRCVLS